MVVSCHQCQTSFEITADDLQCYDTIAPVVAGNKQTIPPPTLCPTCRKKRRLVFRNERNLYNRNCNFCKKDIVSVYSPDKPYIVYCQECWWSDGWEARSYGQEVDFSRKFSEQIEELTRQVPLPASIVVNSVNSDYNNLCADCKDCYLSFRVVGEGVLYSYLAIKDLHCVDCYGVTECQYCYECMDCWNCYNSAFCRLSKNLSDCMFCFNCIGCKNCFGCVDLRNSEYYFFNQKYSKEEYRYKLETYLTGSYTTLVETKTEFEKLVLQSPKRALQILHSQNASGDYITDSKDIQLCFDVEKTDTAKYSWGVEFSKDAYDSDFIYRGERCYEQMSIASATDSIFSCYSNNSHNLIYCLLSFNNSHDCFGCVGLKKGEYCILNKQYSKEEYEQLVPKIIEKMKQDGEWGEFFPASLSPFGYNETVAQEYFPLTKEQALRKGFNWSDYEPPKPDVKKIIAAAKLPDNIKDIPDDILNWAIECEVTRKPYRIIKQELQFYRDHRLPVPRRHPDQRHKDRMALRNPRKLWDRTCMNCNKPIQTTYSPDRPETVYCEECYLKAVY